MKNGFKQDIRVLLTSYSNNGNTLKEAKIRCREYLNANNEFQGDPNELIEEVAIELEE